MCFGKYLKGWSDFGSGCEVQSMLWPEGCRMKGQCIKVRCEGVNVKAHRRRDQSVREMSEELVVRV